jgi:5-methylcytosine-specific restriction protein A
VSCECRKQINPARRLYDYRWSKTSQQFLADNPLCVACLAEGKTAAATCVDHIEPHRGSVELFWRPDNWAALCRPCHARKSAIEGKE